jgi:hypothetical protein
VLRSRLHRTDALPVSAMNVCLAAAAILALVIGLVHSVFGEILVFRRLPPSPDGARGHRRPFDILWASWHIATVMGLSLAALLWTLATTPESFPLRNVVLIAVASAYAASGVLVLVGTRARHPGWIALLGVAVLVVLA